MCRSKVHAPPHLRPSALTRPRARQVGRSVCDWDVRVITLLPLHLSWSEIFALVKHSCIDVRNGYSLSARRRAVRDVEKRRMALQLVLLASRDNQRPNPNPTTKSAAIPRQPLAALRVVERYVLYSRRKVGSQRNKSLRSSVQRMPFRAVERTGFQGCRRVGFFGLSKGRFLDK